MAHLIGHVSGTVISTVEQLQDIMDRIATVCNFHVVARAFHQFEPQGATGVLVLSESHFSAHTYPEFGKVYIDVFCCSKDFNPDECARHIEKYFNGRGEWQVVFRSVNDQVQ